MKNANAIRNFGDLMETIFDAKVGPMFRDDQHNHSMQPPVNIFEKEQNFYLEVMAPGLSKDDIKLQVLDKMLTISYEQNEPAQDAKGKVLRNEFASKSFKRSFTLGETVDAEKINATYEQGILSIVLPKKEIVKPQQIEIVVK